MADHARLTRVMYAPGLGIVAADVEGRLHMFDADLRLLRSSQRGGGIRPANGAPVYALAVDNDWIYTRDKIGNICRWRSADLGLVNRLDAAATCDRAHLLPGEEPSPTMIRGFGVWNGKGYVANGYFQVAVIRLSDFSVERIDCNAFRDRRLESYCTARRGQQVVADREGCVHLGDLDSMAFPITLQVDSGNVHRVEYDSRHDRYWVTLDNGLEETWHIAVGVATVTPDGQLDQRSLWARNDVECLDLAPDGSRVYTGGFDNVLQIYDNTERELRIERTVTGFSHQIIDCTVGSDGSVYVLSQDGELVKLDAEGTFLLREGYLRQCVWDIRLHPTDPRLLLLATDDGIAWVRVCFPVNGSPTLAVEQQHATGLGFTRRLREIGDEWAGIAWDRSVFRSGPDGRLRWAVELDDIVHTLAVSADGTRLLVATTGGAVELDASDGAPLSDPVCLPSPTWAAEYLACGDRVIGSRDGRLVRMTPDGRTVWSVNIGDYPKRMEVAGDRLRVCGGGGVKEILLHDGSLLRTYSELLDNTVENAALVDGIVCAVSYGLQLAAYDSVDGELLTLHEDLPDFPKAVAVVRDDAGRPFVVVGGRGGYLRLYRLEEGRAPDRPVLTPLSDTWLPATAAAQVPHVGQPTAVLVP